MPLFFNQLEGNSEKMQARCAERTLDGPTKEQKERLFPLLREMEQEQDEHKRIGWGMVRIVHSMELVVVENTLKSILRDHEAPTWLYRAARDYAERYDSRYGTGLIPSSAPMMQGQRTLNASRC
jgi:hypothetical protein